MKALLPVMFFIALSSIVFADGAVVNYDQYHTVELTIPKNVSIQFTNNDTKMLNISIGTPEQWLSVNETFFVLNTTNATRSITATILVETYLGAYTKKIPYTITYAGGQGTGELVFHINAIEPQTTIVVDIFTSSFTVKVAETDNGVMKVINNHFFPAFNISITDSHKWVTFDNDNFTLQANESKIVIFTIKPNINHTLDTNQTYHLNIYLKASNTDTIIVGIDVFVPYLDFGNLTCDFVREQQLFFKAKKEFCDAHPTAPECLTEPIGIERNVTVYVKLPCVSNMTEDEANAYHICRNDLNQTTSQLNICLNQSMGFITQIDICNARIQQNIGISQGQGGQYNIIIILMAVLIFLGLIIVVRWFIKARYS